MIGEYCLPFKSGRVREIRELRMLCSFEKWVGRGGGGGGGGAGVLKCIHFTDTPLCL